MWNRDHLLDRFNAAPAATDDQIEQAKSSLPEFLPSEYVQFLKNMNGGEGFIGETYSVLWDVSKIESLNLSYQTHQWAPGLLLFGSDGGGEAFGFDTRKPNWPIVRIPFVGMDWKEARPIGNSFKEFLENLFVGIPL